MARVFCPRPRFPGRPHVFSMPHVLGMFLSVPFAARISTPLLFALVGLVLGLVFLAGPASAQINSIENKRFDIPAGKLEDALTLFARQAGITLTFAPDPVEGKLTGGLRGSYGVHEGLEVLLTGSGLDVVKQGDGTYVLEVGPAERNSEGGEGVSLGMIYVKAEKVAKAGVYEVPVERIRRNVASDMADVFRDEPSVTIGGGARNAQRIYLRGIEGSNLNITIDGARQGRSLFQHRGGIGGLDPDLLKSVQILSGPSADRGAGALGGGIQLETVDAQDLLAPDRRVGATLQGGFAGADQALRGSTSVYGSYDDFGLLAHVSGVNTEDYRTGGGERIHGSAGRDRDYFVKLSVLEKAENSLRLSATKNTNSGLYRWGAGDGAYDGEAVLNYQVSERHTYVVDHRFNPASTPLIDWRVNAYRNELLLENVDLGTKTDSSGWGGEARNTATFNLGATGHRLTVGGDFYSEKGTHKANGIRLGTDNTAKNFGFFIQEQMELGPLLVSLGARYDNYETKFGSVMVRGNELSPSAGAELLLPYGFTAFAGYGEAVRSSGIIPVQWLSAVSGTPTFNSQAGKRSYGREFKPESSRQYQGGLRFGHDNLILNGDRFHAELVIFETRIENLIAQVGGSRGLPVTGFYNDDPMTSKGYELRGGWDFGRFKTSLGFVHTEVKYVDGKVIGASVGNRIGASSGDRLVWDALWRIQDGLNLGYTLDVTCGLHKDDLNLGGYVLHHVQAQWEPAILPNLSLTLAVRNLFDRHYSEQTTVSGDGSAVYEPGRDVRISLAYRF